MSQGPSIHEVQEARKHHEVELAEPREDAPAALESAERQFQFVPLPAEFAVAAPFDFWLVFGGTTGVILKFWTSQRFALPLKTAPGMDPLLRVSGSFV